jgi:uncharacterized protein YegJ (DUF2314 family)
MADVATRLEGLRASPLPVTPLGIGEAFVEPSKSAHRGCLMKNLKLPSFVVFLIISLSSPALVGCQTNSPKDKLVPANGDAQVKKYEDAIAPYVKQARETLPEAKKKYLAGLLAKQVFYVTIKLYDAAKKNYEQAFVRVDEWKGETIYGTVDSELSMIRNHSQGEKLTCNESEILDWTISKPDGTEEGNFVGKFLETYKP